MRRLSDEEATLLAERLAPLFLNLPESENEAHWVSAGKAAYRLCLPLVVGNIREPSEAMAEEGAKTFQENLIPSEARCIWRRMVSVLLEEVG